jgi:hypothetical protein
MVTARIDVNQALVSVVKARPADSNMPIFDNTRLTAVNTCPRWAGVRYGHNKVMHAGSGRALALEAGSALHLAFSAIRLLHLKRQGNRHQMYFHAKRLFPRDDGFAELIKLIIEDDPVAVALFALEYSQYYDDPSDKRRTLVNMEEAMVKYVNRYSFDDHKIWVADEANDSSMVGIEIPFDVIIKFDPTNGIEPRAVRFVGRIDGISVDDVGNIIVEENKSTSSITNTWLATWQMAHQITGYTVIASALTHKQCTQADVIGLQLPQPKSSPFDGMVRERVFRNTSQVNQWLQWFINSVQDFESAQADPLNAATYTHSCTRYFRECSFLPLCASDREEQQNIFDEMVTDIWNPLAEESDA